MSKKTGIAPNCRIGLTVVGKLAATVITSSPCLIAFSPNLLEVSVENATKFADEPEFTVSKHLTPKNEDNFLWNSSLNLPVVNHPSNEASTIFCNSCFPIHFPETGTSLIFATKSFS